MMKVMISRTSASIYEKPCEEAFKEEYIYTDTRTVKHPSDLNIMTEKEWYSKGFNHRLENGHQIKRDFKREGWFVEIDDIWKFADKYGELGIYRAFNNPKIWEVEIYDDYRE